MKPIIYLLTACLFILYSCDKDNSIQETPKPDTPKPDKEQKYEYQYESSKIIDFKVYAGSKEGGKDVTATTTPSLQWNSTRLAYAQYENLTIARDSITEAPVKYEANNYKYKTSNDSLYAWNRYANFWQWYGEKKEDQIEYIVSMYKFIKISDYDAIALVGQEMGMINGKNFFNDNPYRFIGPEHMKGNYDTVAWCNIKHIYKRKP